MYCQLCKSNGQTNTVSPQKYAYPFLHATLRQKWMGRGVCSSIQFVSTVHLHQCLLLPSLKSCVVFLKKLLVECEVENIQELRLHCSYPIHWSCATRNMLVLPVEECRRMVARRLALSVAVGSHSESDSHTKTRRDDLMRTGKGLIPCVYIIRERQKHLDRLIIT